MIKSILAHKRVGSHVDFWYPTHGNLNILRRVRGIVESKGRDYFGVKEPQFEKPHNFSACKIVEK